MKITELIKIIDDFAPIETQESWDNCGEQIFYGDSEVKRVMLAVTATLDIINQAILNDCDLIVSHHPMFFIPFECDKKVPVVSFHTCLDKAKGGTTDTLIDSLNLNIKEVKLVEDFLRIVTLKNDILVDDLCNTVKTGLGLKTFRIVNNHCKKDVQKIAFCAGSGADFIDLAQKNNADVLITGDIKYHTAVDSDIMLFDIGHFESERPVLRTLENLILSTGIEVLVADEKSPFINI